MRQMRIDEFFLTPEEKVVEKLRELGGAARLPLGWGRPKESAVMELFSLDYNEFRRVLLALRRKRLVYYNSNFDKGYFLVSLTPRFREYLGIQRSKAVRLAEAVALK